MRTEHSSLKGELIGVGRIAEVFAWGDGQVLKLFRPEFPADWVEHEARVGRIVCAAGITAPAIGEVVQLDGRKGIVYERVDGPTMLNTIAKSPWTLPRAGRQLAELHVQMHVRTCETLPSQRERLHSTICRVVQLADDVKSWLLAQLDRLPDGNAICHGDFHPDNVMMTSRGPVTIDWATASRGNPLADVARTAILFQGGSLPPSADGPKPLMVMMIQRVRRTFYRTYLRHYCTLRSVAREDVAAWIPIQAAVRLHEKIPGEEARLLAWVDNAFKRGEAA